MPHIAISANVEKITVSADKMFFDIKTQRSIYTGNVQIKQGGLSLSGDKVTLHQKNNQLQSLIVTGKPVRYQQQTHDGKQVKAQSEKMVYHASQHQLVLTENAKIEMPEQQLSSQKIVYDTIKKIVVAGGKSETSSSTLKKPRVTIILTPQATKQK